MVQTLEAWIKTVEEASGGNLSVEMDKAALGKMEGQYDLIKNGVRDLGWAVPGYMEVVRERRFGGQGVHRHDAAQHLRRRAVRDPYRQADQDTRRCQGAQD